MTNSENVYNFADLLKEVFGFVPALKNPNVQVSIDPELPLQLLGSDKHMRQVVADIFSTAGDIAAFNITMQDGALDDDVEIFLKSVTTDGREVLRSISQKIVCMQVFGEQAVSYVLSNAQSALLHANFLIVGSLQTDFSAICQALDPYATSISHTQNLLDAIKQVEENSEIEMILIDVSDGKKFGSQVAKVLRKAGCKQPILGLGNISNDPSFEGLFDDFLNLPLQGSCIVKVLEKHLTINVYDDPEIKKLIRQDFLKVHKTARIEIAQAKADNDFHIAHRIAHNLKGFAILLDNARLKLTAQTIEVSLKQEKWIEQSLLDEMLDLADQIVEDLNESGADNQR